MIPASEKSEGAQTLRARLEALLEIFDLIDGAFQQAFKTDQSLQELRGLVNQNIKGNKS